VRPNWASAESQAAIDRVKKAGWLVVEERGRSAGAARNAGMQSMQIAIGAPGGGIGLDPVGRNAATRAKEEPAMALGRRELARRPLAEQIDLFATAQRHPRRASSWLRGHLKRKLPESAGPAHRGTTDGHR
jgi:hypothetical protein